MDDWIADSDLEVEEKLQSALQELGYHFLVEKLSRAGLNYTEDIQVLEDLYLAQKLNLTPKELAVLKTACKKSRVEANLKKFVSSKIPKRGASRTFNMQFGLLKIKADGTRHQVRKRPSKEKQKTSVTKVITPSETVSEVLDYLVQDFGLEQDCPYRLGDFSGKEFDLERTMQFVKAQLPANTSARLYVYCKESKQKSHVPQTMTTGQRSLDYELVNLPLAPRMMRPSASSTATAPSILSSRQFEVPQKRSRINPVISTLPDRSTDRITDRSTDRFTVRSLDDRQKESTNKERQRERRYDDRQEDMRYAYEDWQEAWRYEHEDWQEARSYGYEDGQEERRYKDGPRERRHQDWPRDRRNQDCQRDRRHEHGKDLEVPQKRSRINPVISTLPDRSTDRFTVRSLDDRQKESTNKERQRERRYDDRQEDMRYAYEERPRERTKEDRPRERTNEDGRRERTNEDGPRERTNEDGPRERTNEDGPRERTNEDGRRERTNEDGPRERTNEDGPRERTNEDGRRERTNEDGPRERTNEDGRRERTNEDGPRERTNEDGPRERTNEDGRRERTNEDGPRERTNEDGKDLESAQGTTSSASSVVAVRKRLDNSTLSKRKTDDSSLEYGKQSASRAEPLISLVPDIQTDDVDESSDVEEVWSLPSIDGDHTLLATLASTEEHTMKNTPVLSKSPTTRIRPVGVNTRSQLNMCDRYTGDATKQLLSQIDHDIEKIKFNGLKDGTDSNNWHRYVKNKMTQNIRRDLAGRVLHLTEKNKEEVSGTIESMKEGDKAIIVVNGQAGTDLRCLEMCGILGLITRQEFENYHVFQNLIADKLITCSSITNRGKEEWTVTESELKHTATKAVVILLERKADDVDIAIENQRDDRKELLFALKQVDDRVSNEECQQLTDSNSWLQATECLISKNDELANKMTDEFSKTYVVIADNNYQLQWAVQVTPVDKYRAVIFNRKEKIEKVFEMEGGGELVACLARDKKGDVVRVYKNASKQWRKDGDAVTNEELEYWIQFHGFYYIYKRVNMKQVTKPKEVKDVRLRNQYSDKLKKRIMGLIAEENEINTQWDDIIGLEDVKKTIRAMFINPLVRPELYTGFYSTLSTSLLLYGPPGTGKTYLCSALAAETKCTLFKVKPSDVLSKYYGESEQFVSCLFDTARAMKPALIFLDECDSIMSERSKGSEHSNTIKNQLLIEMSGLAEQVPVMATSNLRDGIDPAFIRRLGRHIHIGMPDKETREKLLERLILGLHHSTIRTDVSGLNVNDLAEITEGKSPADIVMQMKHVASDVLGSITSPEDAVLVYKTDMFR